MSDKTKLKPCPLDCQHKNSPRHYKEDGWEGGLYGVICLCGLRMTGGYSPEEVAEAWNTQPTESEQANIGIRGEETWVKGKILTMRFENAEDASTFFDWLMENTRHTLDEPEQDLATKLSSESMIAHANELRDEIAKLRKENERLRNIEGKVMRWCQKRRNADSVTTLGAVEDAVRNMFNNTKG